MARPGRDGLRTVVSLSIGGHRSHLPEVADSKSRQAATAERWWMLSQRSQGAWATVGWGRSENSDREAARQSTIGLRIPSSGAGATAQNTYYGDCLGCRGSNRPAYPADTGAWYCLMAIVLVSGGWLPCCSALGLFSAQSINHMLLYQFHRRISFNEGKRRPNP